MSLQSRTTTYSGLDAAPLLRPLAACIQSHRNDVSPVRVDISSFCTDVHNLRVSIIIVLPLLTFSYVSVISVSFQSISGLTPCLRYEATRTSSEALPPLLTPPLPSQLRARAVSCLLNNHVILFEDSTLLPKIPEWPIFFVLSCFH